MPEERRVLLEVKNLKKYFPLRQGFLGRGAGTVKAVDGINLHILQGETLGLVGESGSGKTTAGRTILRAFNPTEGEIIFHLQDGPATDLAKLSKTELRAFRRHAQMIFQDPYSSLNPRMTVRDIIAEPLVAGGVAHGDEVDERVRETARRCQLSLEHLRRYPHAFSGGQRQRIGIARALVVQPQFVVCDEPVSALDVSIQAQILNLLMDMQKELGLTYLFVAHDLSVVEHVSDRVAVMYLGRLVEVAPTAALFYQPLHPYTEALMSAIPALDPDDVMKPVILEGEIPSPANPPTGCHFHPRCPYAQAVCKSDTPEWKEYRPGHFAACHFADTLSLKGALKALILPLKGNTVMSTNPWLREHRPLSIAHRGHSIAYPENTLEAYRKAIELGVEMIECDVNITRDGQLVMMHDPTLDRTTTGSGQVSASTWEEIQRLDAGGKFKPEFAGARVPSTEETLLLYKEAGILSCFEVKGANAGRVQSHRRCTGGAVCETRHAGYGLYEFLSS